MGEPAGNLDNLARALSPETKVAFKIFTESSNSGASASKSSESGASADSGALSSELGVDGLSIESSMDGLGDEPPSWEGGDANGEVGAEPSDGEGVLDGDGDGVKPLPESFGGDALGEFVDVSPEVMKLIMVMKMRTRMDNWRAIVHKCKII
ncbi:hypothetical protein E3N88_13116 [Mikania micrantha]|uniref:Uncharacterized protein n=1 Tax=Mikania micrantha TaxID=192012 RepID=A0A5N6P9Y7_9ASTR|nr:hypothetical protein E3N88_13116 [Mikania micrantha]